MADHTDYDGKAAGPAGPRKALVLALSAAFVLAGVGGMLGLAAMDEAPAEKAHGERPLPVEVVKAGSGLHGSVLRGLGQLCPVHSTAMAPEVAGRVVEVHPALHPGGLVRQGEVLFRLDDRTYRAQWLDAAAEVERARAAVGRLEAQQRVDSGRLEVLARNREIARRNYDRFRQLFRDNGVVSQSEVEAQEKEYNAATGDAAELANAVESRPLEIREAASQLARAEAQLRAARTVLDRCTVRAPFSGRIKAEDLELGQYVETGRQALVLADDSALEVAVSLDGREAQQWLRFAPRGPGDAAWFARPEPVECRISWVDDASGASFRGLLHRVVGFDESTRTLSVAVRVSAQAATALGPGLPLVEGMFCRVEIPGRSFAAVRLPRSALAGGNTVRLAVGNRLATREVEVGWQDDDHAYITRGLAEGELVITSRLAEPLENAWLAVFTAGPERPAGDPS